jgi:uncharacterized protein YecE (DUF72 family)
MEIHVGCSGWFYSHWRGIFYPPREPTTKLWFAYYANVFKTVELNAPFYRWPKPATVRRWKRDAPPGFLYSIKVNQKITHERRMIRTRALVKDFYAIGPLLGEKQGCFLFQFPPSHRYSPSRLKSIVSQLDPAFRNVVEFRHRSWWRPSVYRTLARNRISFCAVSAPRLPEDFPENQPLLYVRLSGKTRWYRHDYNSVELGDWANRIAASGAQEVWIYFNNDRDGHAVKNALMMRRLLTRNRATSISAPAAVDTVTTAVAQSSLPHRVHRRSHARNRRLQGASAASQS